LGYNWRIMWKRLAILGGGALIVAVILMAVYYQQRNAVGEGYNIKCVQPSQPPSAAASLTCKIYPSQDTDDGKPKPPWWNVLLAWPEGITAWLLLLTLSAIVWQAWETRRAAKATEKSVDLNAAANSQWIKLKLLDMYSEVEKGEPDPPSSITLRCRLAILNPSTQPLTLHKVKVDIARDEAWDACEFDFYEVVPPGEDGEIVIVPIYLGAEETAEYLKSGVEYSIAIHALFTGVNGRESSQSWGDLIYFRKGQVEWNASIGKSPQRKYKEDFEGESTIVPTGKKVYESNDPIQKVARRRTKKRN
jgi:hypothetical protein